MNTRIELFVSTGLITLEQSHVLKKWAQFVKDCPEQKKEMLLTHSAMMLNRKNKGETVEKFPEEIKESVINHLKAEESLLLLEQMSLDFPIPEEEKMYMLLHLCNCLDQE